MNWDEYNKLFHKLQLNLIAFQPLMQCDQEVLRLVNAAIEAEREACAVIAFNAKTYIEAAEAIRARGQDD
jgi:ABC-type sugar transport system substrate-binding protein